MQDPLKQGLKHVGSDKLYQSAAYSNARSIKTRIETLRFHPGSYPYSLYSNARSIKTRIETQGRNMG